MLRARAQIWAAVWLIVRDVHVVEDVVQNVAVKILAGDLSFDHESQVALWAYNTARNEAINWARDPKNHTTSLDDELLAQLDEESAKPPAPHDDKRLEHLLRCLDGLPEPSRQLLVMRYFDGQSCQQVAETLGLRLNTVYQRLFRLHRALQGCLERRLGAVAERSWE